MKVKKKKDKQKEIKEIKEVWKYNSEHILNESIY